MWQSAGRIFLGLTLNRIRAIRKDTRALEACRGRWTLKSGVLALTTRRKDKTGGVEPMSILNQKIREFGKKTQNVSVDEFKDYFWQLFRLASNSNNFEMCKNLIKTVPNSLKDDGDVLFKSLEPSKMSPLHYAVQDNFHQLGQWLFDSYPEEMKRHCLIKDSQGKIPLDYMPPMPKQKSLNDGTLGFRGWNTGGWFS